MADRALALKRIVELENLVGIFFWLEGLAFFHPLVVVVAW